MNNRGTLALLVLFFAGLVGLWWADRSGVPDREARRRAEPRVLPALLNTRPDEVRRVEIAGGAETLVFERRGKSRWQMTAPADVVADPSMVETLALNLKGLARIPDAGTLRDDPKDYGLATPSRVIRLFGTDPTRPIAGVEVGSASHGQRFVRAEGTDGIDVVDGKALATVELPPTRWRDRSLLRFSPFQAEGLSAEGPGRGLVLERSGDAWRVLSPYRAPADSDRVEGALAELAALQVADGDAGFVADGAKDLAAFGLDAPAVSITVRPKSSDGPPMVVHLGKAARRAGAGQGPADRYYARRDDEDDVVLVDAHLIKDLGTKPADFHGKKVADLRPDRVDFLRLTSAGSVVTVARDGRGWSRRAPVADRADDAAVTELLKTLDALQASVLFDPGSAPNPGLDRPLAVLEVWEGSGTTKGDAPETPPAVRLTLGRVDPLNKTVYARSEGDLTVLGLPSGFLDGLTLGSLAFRDRGVASALPRDLDRVVIGQGGRSTTIVHPAPGAPPTAWRLQRPVAAPADPESVGRLLSLLANLRAETLVADRAESDAKYGLDTPPLTVAWTTRAEVRPPLETKQAETTTLSVGSTAPGRPGARYARVSTGPVVFTLAAETLAIFESEWRDRQVQTFPIRAIERLTVRWPSQILSARPILDVKTNEPEWTLIDPPPGLDFEASRIKPLALAVSKLSTFRYVQHDGPIPPEAGLSPPRLSVEVRLSGGQDLTLRVGNRTPDGYLSATVDRGPNGTVFLLPLSGWEPWIRPPGPSPIGPRK